MGPIQQAAIGFSLATIGGLVTGIGLATFYWRRRIKIVDMTWRLSFYSALNQTVALLLGGHVKDGVVYLPGLGAEEGSHDPGAEIPDKDKPN